MLNEYVYCPRLFYLEWVDDRFTDNDDTVAGRFAHRAVDRGGGRMPDPDEAEWLRQVCWVRHESKELNTPVHMFVGGYCWGQAVGWLK